MHAVICWRLHLRNITMPDNREIDFVFFDIGGTLGDRDPATKKFIVYPSSVGLLKAMRAELKLRVGIITNLGGQLSDSQALAMLHDAHLDGFIDPKGFVSDEKASAAKPN